MNALTALSGQEPATLGPREFDPDKIRPTDRDTVLLLLNNVPDDFDDVALAVVDWWTKVQKFLVVDARTEEAFQTSVSRLMMALEELGSEEKPFIVDFDLDDRVIKSQIKRILSIQYPFNYIFIKT